jgi:hypothetical protein
MPQWPERALPVVPPSPVTTLKTPGGKPAAEKISARRRVVSGVYAEGLTTVVQPDAKVGARLRDAIRSG